MKAAEYQTMLRDVHCKPCKAMTEQTCLFCQVTTDIHAAWMKELSCPTNKTGA